jgi:tellurite methyltransferase
MTSPDREKWDQIYRKERADGPAAARVLAENDHLLPRRGTALDLACGRGGNALLLAAAGLDTHAWDISAVALKQLSDIASRAGLVIHTRQCDVVASPPDAASFDVIVVSRFLDRDIIPSLVAALRQGGLLFYQTYTADKDPSVGPGNPAYLLRTGELLELFAGLRPVLYRDEDRIGDPGRGFRNEAMLIARKDSEQ